MNRQLKVALATCKSRHQQSEVLKNICKGKKCLVLSCGPSLIDFDENLLEKLSQEYVIFTVKQAQHRFKDYSDFCFFNLGNFTNMSDKNGKTVFCGCSALSYEQSRVVWGEQEINIFDFILDDRNRDGVLAKTKEFEQWTFDNTLARPWGPGIMYETVLYYALHMGFSEVVVNGWDYQEPGTQQKQLKHFYNKDGKGGGLHFFKNITSDMFDSENELIVESSGDFYDFMKSKGMEIKLYSDISHLSERIPRVEGLL